MMTVWDKAEEIKKLPQNIRLAEYIIRDAKLALVGAKLRMNGREDETWTEEEVKEWEEAVEEQEPYWYALSEDERGFLRDINRDLAVLCCGEKIEVEEANPIKEDIEEDYAFI